MREFAVPLAVVSAGLSMGIEVEPHLDALVEWMSRRRR